MKTIEIIKEKKRAFAIVGIVVLALLILLVAGVVALSSGNVEAGDIDGKKAASMVVSNAFGSEIPVIEAGEAQEENVRKAQNGESIATLGASGSEQTASTAQSQYVDTGSSGAGAAPKNTGGSSNNGPSASTSSSSGSSTASQKKWVEDTQKIWVEDKAAWTESVPIYGTKEVSICNVCGADITGNTAAHSKAHMMAGEGSGHHSEVRKTISGYNTVNHPAEGHYEMKVVGGHWE